MINIHNAGKKPIIWLTTCARNGGNPRNRSYLVRGHAFRLDLLRRNFAQKCQGSALAEVAGINRSAARRKQRSAPSATSAQDSGDRLGRRRVPFVYSP
jgi:hypothetical protein